MAPKKQRIIYFLEQPYRIGQLVSEMWRLRNVFYDYDIVVITPPPDQRVNRAVYDFVMRDVKVVHKHPGEIKWPRTEGIKNIDGDLYFFLDHGVLMSEFFKKFLDRKPSFYFSLTEEDIERCNRLCNVFNIPLDAPIITLHNREQGYLPKLTYSSRKNTDFAYHSYRNADIDNYVPAIEYLVRKGYYVVRIGDKTMKPLPRISEQVIDAPFHRFYSPFVELYFIALSKFMISTPSGPDSLAVGFGTPFLWMNTPTLSINWGNENDLITPKKYYSRVLNRYLSYSEILTSMLPRFLRSEDYEQFSVELHQNSPEEILQTVKEMDSRLEGSYKECENPNTVSEQLKRIESRGDYFQQHIQQHLPYYNPNYCLHRSEAHISHEFIKMNPWFLEEKSWIPDIEAVGAATDSLQKDKLLQKISNAEIKPAVSSAIS